MEEQRTDEELMKEMVKKVDKRKLRKLIAMCFNLKDSQIMGLDQLLEEWSKQKVELYKLLGNELKVYRDINISKEKIQQIKQETGMDEEGLLGYWDEEFRNFLKKVQDISPVLETAIDSTFSFGMLEKQMPDIDMSAITSCGADRRFYFRNENEKIPFSTLMHKMFQSEAIDIEVSKYLQKTTANIIGKVYISIDPFDYVTMSMNKSNWSSCHSLHSEDENGVHVGCFSAGIFSYMCDDVSIVAYKTNGELFKYEFNNRSIMAESKNWRQMIFVHPEKRYFIASRQYPYRTEIIAKIVREMIEEKIDNCKEVEEEKELADLDNKWKISRKSYDNKEFIENSKYFEATDYEVAENMDDSGLDYEVLHYNDMLHGFNYEFIYQSKYRKSDLPKIYIGSNPKCVICGEYTLEKHEVPVCWNCNNHTYDFGF